MSGFFVSSIFAAMNYKQTLEHLYAQLPMFSRIGAAAYKADLHNTIALCNAAGNPEKKFKSIHVAGTNGKGSTSHMLAAMLHAGGLKTGLYTSPHIVDIRERIRLNGELIRHNEFVSLVRRMEPALKKQTGFTSATSRGRIDLVNIPLDPDRRWYTLESGRWPVAEWSWSTTGRCARRTSR